MELAQKEENLKPKPTLPPDFAAYADVFEKPKDGELPHLDLMTMPSISPRTLSQRWPRHIPSPRMNEKLLKSLLKTT